MSKPAGTTIHLAEALAAWAVRLGPTAEDLDLAERALLDTMAVTLAARDHPLAQVAGGLQDAARWASIGHVLDFDDLHLPSTAHVSVVCVPAVLASGGDARAYLAAAGVMARLGTALGWEHYARGWHATCTAGAPAAAADRRHADAARAGAAASAGGGGRSRGRPHTGGGAPAADPPAPHHWPPGQVQHGVRARGDAARRLPRLRQLHRRGGQPAGRQGAGGAGRGGHLPGRPGPAGGRRARRAAAHRREHPRRAPGGTFGGAVAAARPRRPRRQAGRLRRRRARAAGRADLAGGRAGAPGAAARRSPGPPARALRLRGGVVAVRPLDGITVVSLDQAVAAPFATRQLADLGARVIKVERPGAGDFARTYDESVRGLSSYFVWLNRSKESLTLDVKAPRGRAVLE